MKNSVKTLLIAAALMGSVTLTACGGNQETAPAENNQAQTETAPAENNQAQTETAPADATAEAQGNNEMSYMTPQEVKDSLDKKDEFIFLDVRKAEDYGKGHVDGFSSADLDGVKDLVKDQKGDMAKIKEADAAAFDQAVANIKAAVKEQTGAEELPTDKTYVLMCYSGKSYAQAGTDFLINELKVPADKIKTSEGGMKAWEAAGQEFTDKVVAQ
ncbi:MAG: rhodanese-like domain-containing protein [Finegoldia sp.]|nr:rhodanese-like domain-containing protein [Finegoldia sp.]